MCPYTAVFQPFVPEGSEKISKNRDIPRPFVIKPPLETKETYLPGERLSFDLVLVGKIKDYLPYFIVTFKELSQAGLGRVTLRFLTPTLLKTGRRQSVSGAKPVLVGFLDLQMVFYSAHAGDLHRQFLGACLLIG